MFLGQAAIKRSLPLKGYHTMETVIRLVFVLCLASVVAGPVGELWADVSSKLAVAFSQVAK